MSDDLKLRIREIEESARKVDRLALQLALKTGERKLAKEDWEAAVERHMELCRNWEDSAEVAERPMIKACEARASDFRDADEDDTDAMEDAEADGFAREAPVYPDPVAADESEAEATGRPIGPFWSDEAEAELDAGLQERSGLDLVTSRPGSDPESNGVETTEKPKSKRRRKAKV